jgi:hypothetical protein
VRRPGYGAGRWVGRSAASPVMPVAGVAPVAPVIPVANVPMAMGMQPGVAIAPCQCFRSVPCASCGA